jgi:signal transduction histidine kinase
MAPQMHDSVGQLLAAIGMNNSFVEAERHKLSTDAAKRIIDNNQIVEEITRQIRTISHLLHPPLLDEAGLASALRCYVEGFSERSRIDVKLDMPLESPRLPEEIELSAFRIVQECLTNVHRHAASSTAAIRVVQEGPRLRVENEDRQGLFRGIEAKSQTGIGIRGMRERLRQLSGTLEIGSSGHGTRVTATIPIVHGIAGSVSSWVA